MTETNHFETLADEIIYEGQFKALFHQNGIVELVWDKDIRIITLQVLENVKEALYQFGQGKRMPVYVATFAFMEVSEDAKQFTATPEAQQYTLANAVQIDNLAKKIMYNFFLKFYGLTIPSKAFKNKAEAFKWLLSHT
ncbi:MAG: hypothetical protein HYZ14_08660 [Bacteroidetes bacterium]|nr:hypothetical protein [Bacteroidota bacterium]